MNYQRPRPWIGRLLVAPGVLGLLLAGGQSQSSSSKADREALIVVALAATEGYDQVCLKWADQLAGHLVSKAGFTASQITLALPEGVQVEVAEGHRVPATKAGIEGAIRRIAANLSLEAELFMFVFGSGSFDGREYKLNLKGPDLSGPEIKDLLAAIQCRRQAIFWGTSSSGEVVSLLSAKGRIVITATRSGMERNDPRFPGFFLESLREPATDSDKDLRISWLEAYLAARARTEQSFSEEGHVATEHALINDTGGGEGHPLPAEENGEGLLAAITYFTAGKAAEGLTQSSPRLQELVKQRNQLEQAIQELKGRRKDLATAEYDRQMEELLLRMAKTSTEIRRLEADVKKPN